MADYGIGHDITSNEPTLSTELRESSEMTLTSLWTKNFHSIVGTTGNLCHQNPGFLCTTLSVMKDGEGRVIIPGYYDESNSQASLKRQYSQLFQMMKRQLISDLGLAETGSSWARPIKRVFKTPL